MAMSTLTLFCIPKRFEGHFGLIQRNAITSWTKLEPRPDIILLGSDDGTAEVAEQIGARHVPEVASSPSGAPMFDDVMRKGQELATTSTVCFINADIVLTPRWLHAVEIVQQWRPQFLMVGRRWDLDVLEPLSFSRADWADALVTEATQRGRMATRMFIDYFVFPRGMLSDLPPFAIGRPGYDNWLLWSVRKRGVPLVDATEQAPVIHQNHDYSHIRVDRGGPGGRESYLRGQDTRRNAELAGNWTRYFTTDHATHRVTESGVEWALARPYLEARLETARRHLVEVTRPLRRKLGIDQAVVSRIRAKLRRR
jgi:hypothetical protein